jgi:hypothetical protein
VIEGVNGTGGTITHTLPLTGSFGADGLFVLADRTSAGTTLVADADLLLDFDFQNGPDSVVLRGAPGVLDALGYGVFLETDVFAGEGAPASDPAAGLSLARLFANVDTDDNSTTVAAAPTPGVASLPEPSGGRWASACWASRVSGAGPEPAAGPGEARAGASAGVPSRRFLAAQVTENFEGGRRVSGRPVAPIPPRQLVRPSRSLKRSGAFRTLAGRRSASGVAGDASGIQHERSPPRRALPRAERGQRARAPSRDHASLPRRHDRLLREVELCRPGGCGRPAARVRS